MRTKIEIGLPIRTFHDGATERAVSVKVGGREFSSRVIFARNPAAYTVLSPTLPQGFTLAQFESDLTVRGIVTAIDRLGSKKLASKIP